MARTGGWELDVETREERWTEGAYEIGEVPPDADFEPTLENSLEFYHPDDRDDAKAAVENCIENGEPFESEFRLVTSKDRLRWAKVAGEPVTENGEVTRVRGAIQDITERKNRERELRELKERLDLAVEGAELGVWDWDVESGEITHNQRWAEMFGLPPEEGTVTVGSVRERSHPEDVTEVEGMVEKALSGERDRYDAELRSMTADGDWKWVRTIGKVVERGEDGRAERVVGVNIDTDERKERERNLEDQNERLEEFASIVSHDLRNPLAVAKGRLELAQKDCDSEHLGDLEGSLDRMEDLIEDILALASEGTGATETEPIDIGETAEGCWQNVETEGARLVTETDTRVRADPGSFKRLCENLVRNAVEHGSTDGRTGSDGAVGHADRGVTVTVGELDDRDGFYVADDGPGIPEEEREEAFETGYSTSEDGTGLGLSVVERVAEAHGWEVELKESETGGARFEISEVEVVE
jgi:PAS domain S-box-containing protein